MKKPKRRPTHYNRKRNAEKRARNSTVYKAFHKTKLSRRDRLEILTNGWAAGPVLVDVSREDTEGEEG